MTDTHTGSCNCGAVRFRTTGTLRGIVYCHCSQCRKQSGHFFAATSAEASRLEIDGEDAITWYAGSPQALRGFCRIAAPRCSGSRKAATRSLSLPGPSTSRPGSTV
jgi:hypothetical protein